MLILWVWSQLTAFHRTLIIAANFQEPFIAQGKRCGKKAALLIVLISPKYHWDRHIPLGRYGDLQTSLRIIIIVNYRKYYIIFNYPWRWHFTNNLPPLHTPPMVERSKVVNSQAIESPGHPRTRTAKRTWAASVTKDGNGGFNELHIYIYIPPGELT